MGLGEWLRRLGHREPSGDEHPAVSEDATNSDDDEAEVEDEDDPTVYPLW